VYGNAWVERLALLDMHQTMQKHLDLQQQEQQEWQLDRHLLRWQAGCSLICSRRCGATASHCSVHHHQLQLRHHQH
jgi:hypothetical protein